MSTVVIAATAGAVAASIAANSSHRSHTTSSHTAQECLASNPNCEAPKDPGVVMALLVIIIVTFIGAVWWTR